ncbi:UNVERIFIED_CONTAM: hypothetical protein ABIC26_003372 [Paenibacillus sp. PvR008]
MKWITTLMIFSMLLLTVACSSKPATSSNKELELSAANISSLVLDNSNGKIEVIGKKDTDKIQASVIATGNNMDKLKLSLEGKDGVATLNAFFEGQFMSTGAQNVDIKLTIPEQIKLEIKHPHRDGDIQVTHLASDVSIDNVNGNITLQEIGGAIDLKNRDGEITIQDSSSDVNIENVNGHIKADKIGGTAYIELGDGSLDINQVSKDVVIIQSGNGKVSVGDVKGKVTQSKK